MSDAAIKVVGKEVAGQCEWMVRSQNDPQDLTYFPPPDGSLIVHSPESKDDYIIQAFLPRPQCGTHNMSQKSLDHLSNDRAQISQSSTTAAITSP